MKSTIRYVIVADTETGGLPSKGGKGKPAKKAFVDVALCEIALVVVDLWEMKIVEEYDAIIAPYTEGLEYNPNAEAVHGLSVAHLTQNGQDIKDVYLATKTYLKKYANSKIGAVLAGHNFQLFDIPFFEEMFAFCKDNLWDYVKFVEDTMKMAWYRAEEQENYKLGTCCRQEGVELVDAHSALHDTRANALLFLKYIAALRGTGAAAQTAPTQRKSRFRETFQLV